MRFGPVRIGHHGAFLAVMGFDELKSGIAEQAAQDAAVVLIIFDDEDEFAHAGGLCSGGREAVSQF